MTIPTATPKIIPVNIEEFKLQGLDINQFANKKSSFFETIKSKFCEQNPQNNSFALLNLAAQSIIDVRNQNFKSHNYLNRGLPKINTEIEIDDYKKVLTQYQNMLYKIQKTYKSKPKPSLFDYGLISAEQAKTRKVALCSEMSFYCFFEMYSKTHPSTPMHVITIENGDHVLLVVGEVEDITNPATYKNAVVIDPWTHTFFPGSEFYRKCVVLVDSETVGIPKLSSYDDRRHTIIPHLSKFTSIKEFETLISSLPLSSNSIKSLSLLKSALVSFHGTHNVEKKLQHASRLLELINICSTRFDHEDIKAVILNLESQMNYFIQTYKT